jgi:cytochrome c peroxidase
LRKNVYRLTIAACGCALVVTALASATATAREPEPGLLVSLDPSGQLRTLNVNGDLDVNNAFFQDLGTNGRRCVTCHQPAEAWSIAPEGVRARFRQSRGTDPIFTNNDGSNCEGATPHTLAEERAAYSLLLTRGLIRIGLDVPPNAEFVVDEVDDPFHCVHSLSQVSMYRRPLPSTNLRFLTAVMWDGRESSATTTILEDLAHQANDATRGHAAGVSDISPDEARQIVDFETGLYTTQARDLVAGGLSAAGARGGPGALSRQPFFLGINDPVGMNPSGAAFDPAVFTIFDAWASLRPSPDHETVRRRSIARGQAIFNTKAITLSGVAGLNGQMFPSGVTPPASFQGTCTICHDSPNAGDHSVKAPLNIGLAEPAVAPYLPVYTLRRVTTGETVTTTDPGRAMVSGKWADIGKFKGPILRGLAARAPYFHNGSAQTLEDVVDFYDTRFAIGFTAQEKADLAAFLRAL